MLLFTRTIRLVATTFGRAACQWARCSGAVVLGAALLAMGMGGPAFAQGEEAPRGEAPGAYGALGGPADAEVEAHWNRYYDYQQAVDLLHEIAAAHPEICQMQSLGKSYEERDMWLLTITNFEAGPLEERAAMWIDGGIHANEIQSVEVVLYTAWLLTEMYDENDYVERLLNERVFYLMPMMSPDSRDAHFHEANSTHSPRTGMRPRDDDRDGLVDEDGPDDLNGDGSITQMRIRDVNGQWKTDEEFPQMMVRVEEGEQGEYRLLGSEGFDNDGDGSVNEDGDGAYDPNRNWAWNWQPSYVQGGSHRYPLSIGEDRLVADFIMSRPHIAGAQTYHNTGGMILYGPGVKGDSYPAEDQEVLAALAAEGLQILPGYRYLNVAEELYEVYGGEFDWLYQMQGIFALNNELFTPYNFFRDSEEGGFFGRTETRHLFNRHLLLGGGVVPWQEVEHPQYGLVEVGGFPKTWGRQPPSFLMEEELHRNAVFTFYHADEMPKVQVQAIETEEISPGLYQVTAIVENQRLIPTHSRPDVQRRITAPDRVSITTASGQPVEVVLGLIDDEPFFDEPEQQRRNPAQLQLSSLRGHEIAYTRWLTTTEGPYRIEIRSVKGGVDSAQSNGNSQ